MMVGLPSIRYPRPIAPLAATAWGRDWRLRWFRHVGSVHQHHATGQLVAFYSDDRDPTWRLKLQRELEGRASGVAEVLGAALEHRRAWDRIVDAGYLNSLDRRA